MMNLNRVLAATDFSHAAQAAVQRAAGLAKASGALLELGHAIQVPPIADAWRRLVEGEGITAEKLCAGVVARLSDLAAQLVGGSGTTPETAVLIGKPAPALAAWARERQADLLVVGAHGEHLLLDLVVGATAMKLLRLASTPVLMVKRQPDFDYQRILIATDFSPASRVAADWVAQRLPDAYLYLFHAFEVPFEREMYYAGSSEEVVGHWRSVAEVKTRQCMADFVASLREPTRFLGRVRHGYPPALVKQYAAEMRADLLVVGAHRQSRIEAALLGSVATHLIGESPGDLLLVPSTEAPEA